jgi:hypothetical protein
MNIALVLGTARKNNHSAHVAAAFRSLLEQSGADVTVVSPEEHVIAPVTVPPGYPGEWKLLVDKLKKEYRRKPAGLIGVSDGLNGGARVIEQVKPILIDLELFIMKRAYYVRNVDTALAGNTFIHEKEQKDATAFAAHFLEFVARFPRV